VTFWQKTPPAWAHGYNYMVWGSGQSVSKMSEMPLTSSFIINFYLFYRKVKNFLLNINVFGIVIIFMVVVGKKLFYKNIFSWGWFNIYICLVKTVIEIEVEQKIV